MRWSGSARPRDDVGRQLVRAALGCGASASAVRTRAKTRRGPVPPAAGDVALELDDGELAALPARQGRGGCPEADRSSAPSFAATGRCARLAGRERRVDPERLLLADPLGPPLAVAAPESEVIASAPPTDVRPAATRRRGALVTDPGRARCVGRSCSGCRRAVDRGAVVPASSASREVSATQWLQQGVLFVLGGGADGAPRRDQPPAGLPLPSGVRAVDAEQQSLDRYRESLEPLRRLVLSSRPPVLAAVRRRRRPSQQWETVLLFLNGGRSASDDPQFGLDIGVLRLHPARSCASSSRFLTAVLVLALHRGGVPRTTSTAGCGLQGTGQRIDPRPRASHMAVLARRFVLLIAANYWLDRYSLLTEDRAPDRRRLVHRRQRGAAGQGDPAVIARARRGAVRLHRVPRQLAAAGHRRRADGGLGDRRSAASTRRWCSSSRSSRAQQTREAEYIQRNIDATRAAYGLDDVEIQPYNAEDRRRRQGALREDAETTASIRLLDPALVSPTFRQLQQNKQYYNFPDPLVVDRYDDRRREPRHRDRRPRARPRRPAAGAAQLGQRPHGLHPRLRRRRRLRQPAQRRRPARRSSSSGIPSDGSSSATTSRASTSASGRPTTRSSAPPRAPSPRELDFPDDDADGNGQHELHRTQATAARRWATC